MLSQEPSAHQIKLLASRFAFFRNGAAQWRECTMLLALAWRQHRYLTIASFALSLVQGASSIVFVILAGYTIGYFATSLTSYPLGDAGTKLAISALATTAAFLIQYATWPTLSFVVGDLGRRIDGDVRHRLLVALAESKNVARLESLFSSDEFVFFQTLSSSTYTPGRAIGAMFRTLATWVSVLGQSAVVAALVSPLLALLLTGTLAFLRIRMVRDLLANASPSVPDPESTQSADYCRRLLVGPDAAKEIRIYALADWITERFQRHWFKAIATLQKQRVKTVSRPWVWSLPWGGMSAVALVLLAYAATKGDISLTAAAVGFQACLGALNVWIHNDDIQLRRGTAFITALVGLERFIRALPPPERSSIAPPAGKQGLSLHDVWFRYPAAGTYVLKGVTLDVPHGSSLAIVGANGAGKTTIAKLVARLYEPSRGAVFWDGQLDFEPWRPSVAAVFQDYVRFEMSVRENLAMGNRDAIGRATALEQAARDAGILDLIETLPQGWDTQLSTTGGGTDLSGGQWQRMAIARALFAVQTGAKLLILDEPTASLDVRSEMGLFRQVLNSVRGTTTILISHRFSTVRHADKICVIDDGVVIEQGSHAELIQRNGFYAQSFRLQAEPFANESDKNA